MSDNMSMADLLAQYEKVEDIRRGDVVDGKIIAKNNEEAIVNIGYMSDGLLPKAEVFEEEWETLEIGETLPCFIVKINENEGTVLLSSKRAQEIVVWDMLKALMQDKKKIEVRVKEAVKGGVVATYKSARLFIPASQLDLHYVEDLSAYVGQKLEVLVQEVDEEKKKAIASHKVILKQRQELARGNELARLKEGETLTGTVVRLADYGAFVNLGSVDGLIHISQLSWKRVKHPSEVVKEGDVVEVIVTQIDRDSERVGLKLAKIQENPWTNIHLNYAEDTIVSGTVTRLTKFGAFIELEEGIEGLCHISELSEQHISRVQEVVNVGDTVDVYILSIDAEQQQMALSIKAVTEEEGVDYDLSQLQDEEETPTTLSDLFGDKLKNLTLK